MNIFPNGLGHPPRILLLGGTSEIGLAILASLGLPADAEVILAGRDEQRLIAAGKELPGQVQAVRYDAMEVDRRQLLETEAMMVELNASSKLNAEWAFLSMLREEGRVRADAFLLAHGADLGVRSTFDLAPLLEGL